MDYITIKSARYPKSGWVDSPPAPPQRKESKALDGRGMLEYLACKSEDNKKSAGRKKSSGSDSRDTEETSSSSRSSTSSSKKRGVIEGFAGHSMVSAKEPGKDGYYSRPKSDGRKSGSKSTDADRERRSKRK